ncbi:hypothetical protein PoB_000970600 [Plakobranchus ocellatus]|uniref:Uncharacterized protein n=1 Tax=Plakobranchus ocellatus TaxID=259542 RepID=A0AAV3YLD3_9GAST|nr:hypothetical protein PoB_000970600 [Plakobranchus ocellatus]
MLLAKDASPLSLFFLPVQIEEERFAREEYELNNSHRERVILVRRTIGIYTVRRHTQYTRNLHGETLYTITLGCTQSDAIHSTVRIHTPRRTQD